MKFAITSLILCMLLFSYEPAPSPPLDPNDVPFIYDPNQCLSEPMIALIIRVGELHTGELKVTEPDGDPVTIILDVNNVIVGSIPTSVVKDPNDPEGIAIIYYYEWSWAPTAADVGLHYINIYVTDPYTVDNSDERTMIILVKENRPPVITGCR